MKVELGTLKDKAEDVVAFLEPRVGTKPTVSGSEVEIDDEGIRKGVKPRHVKTYLKRFLYTNNLRKNYRVQIKGQELTVQELELGEKEEEERERVKEKLEEAEKKEKEEREEEEGEKEPEKEPEKVEEAAPAPEKKPEKKPEKVRPKVEKKKAKGGAKKKEKEKEKEKSEG
jgi:sRNA-binding protein